MTTRIGSVLIVEPEPPAACELCGKVDELRPYGPHDEQICFDCGQKDWKTTKRQMNRRLFGPAPRTPRES